MERCLFALVLNLFLNQAAIAQATLEMKTETLGNVSFNMVKVEGGSFLRDTHEIKVAAFQIMETEVTQALWEAVMGSNPSEFKACADCPVEMVSWDDVQMFIKKLNSLSGKQYRLPSEAEWEFAARGGNKTKQYRFAGSNTLNDVGWHNGNNNQSTKPVKSKLPNELGLYDMSGNVFEWCSDWYSEHPSVSKQNPNWTNMGKHKVLKGGCWDYDWEYCASTFRTYSNPGSRLNCIGFRLLAPFEQ